jgi:hypothetical protein
MTNVEALLRYLLESRPTIGLDRLGELDRLRTTVVSLEVGGAFYAAARRRGHLEHLGPLTRELRSQHARNVTQAMRLQHDVDEIRRCVGAPVALLKGASLAEHGLLADPGERTMLDVDLLTRRVDRARIVHDLRKLGYTMDTHGGAPKHLPAFRRGPTMLEVHEFAFWARTGRKYGLDELERQPEPLAFTLVHLVHHALVSSVVAPGLVTKTLGDVARIWKAFSHRPGFASAARELAAEVDLATELRAFVACADALVEGLKVPRDGERILRLCQPTTPAEQERRYATFYLRALLSAPSWYRRATLISLIAPSRAAVEASYRLKQGSRWAYAAYALRPFHLAIRGIQAMRPRRS